MANKSSVFLSYLSLFSLLFAILALSQAQEPSPAPESDPSCSGIVSKVAYCLPYITDMSPSPSDACCNGIKSLAAEVKTHADAVSVCTCLKNQLSGIQVETGRIADSCFGMLLELGLAVLLSGFELQFDNG